MTNKSPKTPGVPHLIDVHVGAVVRRRRKELKINQTELAEAVGLTFQQIQKYERGTNRISASKLYEISQFLKMPVGYVFDGLPIDDPQDIATSDPITESFLRSAEGQTFAAAFSKLSPVRRRGVTGLVRSILMDEDSAS